MGPCVFQSDVSCSSAIYSARQFTLTCFFFLTAAFHFLLGRMNRMSFILKNITPKKCNSKNTIQSFYKLVKRSSTLCAPARVCVSSEGLAAALEVKWPVKPLLCTLHEKRKRERLNESSLFSAPTAVICPFWQSGSLIVRIGML